MKTLQINAVYNYASTGRTVAEIHREFIKQGIESFVACSMSRDTNEDIYYIGLKLDVKIHGLLSRISGRQGYFSYFATKKLLRYINSINPDIVHLHNLHNNYINFPMLLKYLAANKIIVVLTLHDCWFFTGKCCYYTEYNCYKWKKGCDSCIGLKKDNTSWFFDKTNKNWEDKKEFFSKIDNLGVVGVSDWITDQAKQSLLSSAKVIKRIYNWVDLDIFKPKDTKQLKKGLGLEDNFVILGVSSDWGERKGLNQFIELSKYIESRNRIILVGRLKDNIKLPGNIIHVDQTDNVDQLADYYSMADVFVHLCSEETFGKVTAEALSCGTPAIVYNATANPELIGEGCGYIAENKNLQQVVDYIGQIKKNGKEYYSDNCRKYVQINFEKDKVIGEQIEMYKELYEMGVK